MPHARRQLGQVLSDAVVFFAFALVPAAASPGFVDQFTSVKWYVLEVVSVAWFLSERLLCGDAWWPMFVRRTRMAWLALGALVLWGSLRGGFGWALEPLLARACFVVLILSSFWTFRRTGLRLTSLRAGVATSSAIVVAMGIAQACGLRPLPWLTAGDQRSATFGNANMAAEFVGLALVVILSWGNDGDARRRRTRSIALEVLAAGGLAYAYLLGTRSVMLGIGGALLFLAGAGRLPARPLLRAAAGAALLVAFVHGLGPETPLVPTTQASKLHSVDLRLAVWADTVRLIRDRPLGVGAGNFEHGFLPYALTGRSRPDESLVFRSPHNDALRLLAEEGWIAAGIVLWILCLLVLQLHCHPVVDRWRSPPGRLLGSAGAFLVVEAGLQFPFEMAVPALLAAVLLGLACACLEPAVPGADVSHDAGSSLRRLAAGATSLSVAAGILWALSRVVTAETLFVTRRHDLPAQERACRLDPRRLDACVQAAWLRSLAGDSHGARAGLVEVLDRSPAYYPAIKLLGEDALARRDTRTGCGYLGIYDQMFGGRSSVHERLARDCPQGDPLSLRAAIPRPPCPSFPLAPGDASLRPPATARRGCW